MKASRQILKLPIISVQEGVNLGNAKEILVDLKKRILRFIIVDDDQLYWATNVIDMTDVLGIGEDAILIRGADSIKQISQVNEAIDLLKSRPYLINRNIINQKGKNIGVISEFFLDGNTGRLIGCSVNPYSQEGGIDFISDGDILTYGPTAVVVNIEALPEKTKPAEIPSAPRVEKDYAFVDIEETDKEEPVESVQHKNVFIERQKVFLKGRHATKDIFDLDGNIIITNGTVLTDEIIEAVAKAGKLVELTMNSKP